MDTFSAKKLPAPSEYMEHAQKMESDCESATDAALSNAGEKAPKCAANLTALLVQMDAVSGCHWGCHGGDHRPEYLAGRLVSSVRASLALLRKGFYDESFNITRSIGEIANLLFLFAQDRPSYERWVMVDDTVRRQEFSQVMVRRALEERGLPIPMDQGRYSALSGIATHVSPQTRPNAYNPHQRPKSGGYFEFASSIAALNELAGAFAIASFAITQLIPLSEECKAEVTRTAHTLLKSVGGLSLAEVQKK